MAMSRSDRDRRILGDRVVARQDEFAEMHSLVAEVHGLFSETHAGLNFLTDERAREESEDVAARRTRKLALDEVVGLYAWAYEQLSARMRTSWELVVDDMDVEDARGRLFPMGSKASLSEAPQRAYDAAVRFVNALGREQGVAYPEQFLQDFATKTEALRQALQTVTRESDETTAAIAAVVEARNNWDRLYRALREITSGVLILRDESDRFAPLFRNLARGRGKSPDDKGNGDNPRDEDDGKSKGPGSSETPSDK